MSSHPISESSEAIQQNFFVEFWLGVRPYLLCVTKDFFVSAMFYLAIFFYDLLSHRFPIEGWAGKIVVQFHSLGIVVALLIFGIFTVNDFVHLRRDTHQ